MFYIKNALRAVCEKRRRRSLADRAWGLLSRKSDTFSKPFAPCRFVMSACVTVLSTPFIRTMLQLEADACVARRITRAERVERKACESKVHFYAKHMARRPWKCSFALSTSIRVVLVTPTMRFSAEPRPETLRIRDLLIQITLRLQMGQHRCPHLVSPFSFPFLWVTTASKSRYLGNVNDLSLPISFRDVRRSFRLPFHFFPSPLQPSQCRAKNVLI